MCGDGEKKTYDSHKLNNFFYIYQILFETGFSFSIYLFSFLHLGFLGPWQKQMKPGPVPADLVCLLGLSPS